MSVQSTKNDTINLDLRVQGKKSQIKGRAKGDQQQVNNRTDEESEMLNLIEETNSVSGYVSQEHGSSYNIGKRHGLQSASQRKGSMQTGASRLENGRDSNSTSMNVGGGKPPRAPGINKTRSSLGLMTAGRRIVSKTSRLQTSDGAESSTGQQ